MGDLLCSPCIPRAGKNPLFTGKGTQNGLIIFNGKYSDMIKIFATCLSCFFAVISFAQKQTYDVITYTPPKKWKKEANGNIISYSTVNEKNKTWCRIQIVKSTVSQGSIDKDFESEWQELVVKNYHPTGEPELNAVEESDGWKIKAGTSSFEFNNSPAIVILTTASGYDRCASIYVITNSQDYLVEIEKLMNSVVLEKPLTKIDSKQPTTIPAVKDNYAFNSTNFDDGWTSTVKEDWVEVTKGSIKVLLHYPKEGTIFPADPAPLTNAAWDILVAPRYSDLKNYKTSYITTYDRPYLGMGYATENSTRKNVFIVFFRQGNTGWLEFVAPDKNSFIQQFKFDPEAIQWDSNTELLIPLSNMAGYNKFAVAASDFGGKWSSDFTGIQQLYNVYTGQYAGMNMNQSNEEFVFGAGNSYNWKLLVVKGMVGNAKFTEVKSSGQFKVLNSWQVHFSKIEDRARTYHAFWSCIKGARVLNLLDANSPGSGIYTKYGLAK